MQAAIMQSRRLVVAIGEAAIINMSTINLQPGVGQWHEESPQDPGDTFIHATAFKQQRDERGSRIQDQVILDQPQPELQNVTDMTDISV